MKIHSKSDAEKLVRNVISNEPGLIGWSSHCRIEMKNDDLITNDLINVLKNGKIRRKPLLDTETNEYKYRIETSKICIVFKFRRFVQGNKSDVGVKLITCWRKGDL